MMQLSWPISGEKVVAVAPGKAAAPKVIGSLLTLYWCSQAAYRLGITVMLPTCHVYWAWNPKSVTHDSSLSLWILRGKNPPCSLKPSMCAFTYWAEKTGPILRFSLNLKSYPVVIQVEIS